MVHLCFYSRVDVPKSCYQNPGRLIAVVRAKPFGCKPPVGPAAERISTRFPHNRQGLFSNLAASTLDKFVNKISPLSLKNPQGTPPHRRIQSVLVEIVET